MTGFLPTTNMISMAPTKEVLENPKTIEYFNNLQDGEKYTYISNLINNSTSENNFNYQPLIGFLNKYATKSTQIYFTVRFPSIFGDFNNKYTINELKNYINDPYALITEELFTKLVASGVTPKEIFSVHPDALSYATTCNEDFRLQTLKDVSYNDTEKYLSTKNLRALYANFLQKKYLEICAANPLRYIEFPKVYRYKAKFINIVTPYITSLKDKDYINIPLHALKNLPYECMSHEFVFKLIHAHLMDPKSDDDNIKCIYWGIRTTNNEEKTQIADYLTTSELTTLFINAGWPLNKHSMQFTTLCSYAAKITKFTAKDYDTLISASNMFADAVYTRIYRYDKNIEGIEKYWLKFANIYPIMFSLKEAPTYIKDDNTLCGIINSHTDIPNISGILIHYGRLTDDIVSAVLARCPNFCKYSADAIFKSIKDIKISKETFFKIMDKQDAYTRRIEKVIECGKLVNISKDDILIHYLPIQPRDVVPLVSDDMSDATISTIVQYLKGTPYLLQVCGKSLKLLKSPDIYDVFRKCNTDDINEFLANYDIDEIPEDVYLFLSLSYNVRKTIRLE